MDYLLNLIINSSKLPWILGAIASVFAYIFHAFQKGENPFDFAEMFIDPNTKLTSLTRFGQFVALVTSSWAFVYLVLNNQLTEMFLTVYVGTWAGAGLVSKGIAAYTVKKVDKSSDEVDTVSK